MKEKKLRENDFIHEDYKKNPYPFWVWLFVILLLACLLWIAKHFYYLSQYDGNSAEEQARTYSYAKSLNFNDVTNRQFSLFLWQNPEYMRVNFRRTGYLPAFQVLNKVTVEPELADKKVIAPPEIIFMFHMWNSFLAKNFIERPILRNEFINFLNYCEEWQSQYWKKAPKEFVELEKTVFEGDETDDLSKLDYQVLPVEVRIAFQGWKNYFFEGHEINQNSISFDVLRRFLDQHLEFGRSYFKNVLSEKYPHYLKSLETNQDGFIDGEIAPFLRVAIYNFQQAQLNK